MQGTTSANFHDSAKIPERKEQFIKNTLLKNSFLKKIISTKLIEILETESSRE